MRGGSVIYSRHKWVSWGPVSGAVQLVQSSSVMFKELTSKV